MIPVARPFLKWVGGKRQLIPQITPHLPRRIKRYHEPFVGAGALFFHLRALGLAKEAVLSDANERLIRTWRGVRDRVEGVIERLAAYPNTPEFFEEMRGRSIDSEGDADVAAWFIYLNRTAYNGLYRVNRHNRFNAPFGRYEKPTICDAENLRLCSAALQGVEVYVEDFARVLERATRRDFVYADPPYVPLTETASFTGYTAGGFGMAEQVRLRDMIRALKLRGVRVLASNSSAATVRELYADFQMVPVSARRAVSCQIEGRGPVTELLIA